MAITKLSDFCIDSDGMSLTTIHTDRILCIVGLDEIKHVVPNNRHDAVLISITEPDSPFLPDVVKDRFHAVLDTQFWDVTEQQALDIESSPYAKSVPCISHDEGTRIREFILQHADKQFAVHCHAGISRSAATAQAIMCLLDCGGSVYDFRTGYDDPVKRHWRYGPNHTVFERIVGEEK